MAIVFKDFNDIELTPLIGTLRKNVKIPVTDMLRARVYFDDTWSKPAKGIITYHFGTGGGSPPGLTDGRVMATVPRGYICIVFLSWVSNPSGYGYNNYFPTHEWGFSAFEQQSYLEFIYERLVVDITLNRFINTSVKTVFAGTSKGAGQILAWSALARSKFANYAYLVLYGVCNAPSGGLSGSPDGKWAQHQRNYRTILNSVNNASKPMKVIFPIGDVTHLNRSFAERVHFFNVNPLVETMVYGNDASYTHGWTYSKPEEFMKIAVEFFEELINS